MKRIMWIAVGVIACLCVTAIVSDDVQYMVQAAASHMDRLILGSGNYGTDPNSTADITLQNDEYIANTTDGEVTTNGLWCVDDEPLSKSMVFYVADTGANDVTPGASWTWANDVTIIRMDYRSQTEIGGNAVTATLKTGATTMTCTIDSGAVIGSQTTGVSFSAADACSLNFSDGAAGTGGVGYLTIQYQEKSD